MKKIPLKNYLILLIILAVCGFGAIYTMLIFKTNIKNDSNKTKLVDSDELNSYIKENQVVIIYFADSKFENSKFEASFKKFITKYDLENQTVYANNNNQTIVQDKKIKKSSYIIIVDSSRVISILPINVSETSTEQIEKVLEEIEVL